MEKAEREGGGGGGWLPESIIRRHQEIAKSKEERTSKACTCTYIDK